MKSKGLLFISVLLCLTCTSSLFAENESHKKGSYKITFDMRSSLSSLEEMKERKIGEFDQKGKYKIENITYRVTVPDDYDPSQPMGLFVWISAGDSGMSPKQFLPPLARNGFIYIGADMAGNAHPITRRLGTAIDAAVNMKKLYNIDPSRIYVSGNSGGGRCASEVAIMFPEVFTGGAFYMIGCNFWDNIQLPGNKYTPGFWPEKKTRLIKQAKEHYFVFLTGSKDFNKPGTVNAYDAYQKKGFKHCKYIEVPDMGHTCPPSEYFNEGLAFLNSTLTEKGQAALQEGIKKVKLKKYGDAIPFFQTAKGCGIEEAQAQIDEIMVKVAADTEKGLKYLEEKKTIMARAVFQKTVDTYGETIAAKAREEIDKIDNDPAAIKEKEAAKLYQKIRRHYKSAGKAKTAEYLKKLIADYPDTVTAENAKTTLKKMEIQ